MRNRRIMYLIALILWGSLIFFFSSRPGYVSDTDSEVLIEKFADIQKSVNESNSIITMHYSPIFIVRKTAHIILYGVLTYLFFNVYYSEEDKLLKPFIFSIGSAVLFAMSDELHQHFVPGRTGLLWDVQIDSYGIFASATLVLITYKLISIEKRRRFVRRTFEIFFALFLVIPFIILTIFKIMNRDKLNQLFMIIRGNMNFKKMLQ